MLALVLAAVGIYGVTSYTTRQRTHEIGIRLALGASRSTVLRLVLGRAMLLTSIGVVFGFALSLGITRFMKSLLLGISNTDAVTFVGVALLLSVVAFAASLIPAHRAMRLDPLRVLRVE